MIKRLFVIFLCFFFTGCSSQNNDVITLNFSTWGSASEMKILTPIIAEYEKENPNVKIKIQHIPQDYFNKLHLLYASNLEPDVVFINNLNLPIFSSRLEDLSDKFDKKNYYPQSLNAMSDNGHVCAIPRDISVLVIYYNKDLFDKNGERYPDKNWSYSDLYTKAKELSKNGIFGIGYDNNVYYALPYIRACGGDIFNVSGEYTADKIEFKKGINSYKNLAYKYHYAPTKAQTGSKTVAQLFLEGRIAMHLSGRWMVPKYRECAKFNWDVVNFPNCYAPSDASGWAISKSSKHKEEALKFVLYLSSKENISKMAESGLIIPARKDVAESDLFLKGTPEHSDLFLRAVKYSKNTTVDKNYTRYIDTLNDTYFQN